MVSLSQIESAIVEVFGGPVTQVRARLQYLNTTNFPPGFRVGRAKRADYGLEEALALAVWFSLNRMSLAPAAASGLVTECWPEFVRAAVAAAGKLDLIAPTARSGTLLRLHVHGAGGVGHDGAISWVTAFSEDAPGAELTDPASTTILLNMTGLFRRLTAALEAAPLPLPRGEICAAAQRMRDAEGWSVEAGWDQPGVIDGATLLPLVSPARGTPLSRMDFFCRRAHLLIDGGRSAIAPWQASEILDYLIRPLPREAWKQRVEVGASGVPLLWALAHLLERTTGVAPHIPATIQAAVANRLADAAIAGVDDLRRALRHTVTETAALDAVKRPTEE